MNPATLLRIWRAFVDNPYGEVHVLAIAAISGSWPGTVYEAGARGYLVRTEPGVFRPTKKLRDEIKRVERIRKYQQQTQRYPSRVGPARHLKAVR